jgi:hypothetical protein
VKLECARSIPCGVAMSVCPRDSTPVVRTQCCVTVGPRITMKQVDLITLLRDDCETVVWDYMSARPGTSSIQELTKVQQ